MRQLLCITLLLFSVSSIAQKNDTLIRYFNLQLEPCKKKEAAYIGMLVEMGGSWNTVVFDSAMKIVMRGNYLDEEAKIKNGYFSYFNEKGKRVLGGEYAQNKRKGLWQTWYASGNSKDSVFFVDDLADGPCSIFFENGKQEASGQYLAGTISGKWYWYHENGQLASSEIWKDGLLEDINCYDSIGHPQGMNCSVSSLPTIKGKYGGFEKFVADSLRYPEKAAEKEEVGAVVVAFTITQTGQMDNIQVLQSSDESFTTEALRMLSTITGWYPAVFHNRKKQQRLVYSINFPSNTVQLLDLPDISPR